MCNSIRNKIFSALFCAILFLMSPASFTQAQEIEEEFDFINYLSGTWTIEWTQGENTFKEIDIFLPDVSGTYLMLEVLILRDGSVFQTGSGIVARDAGGTIHHSFAGSSGNVIKRTGRMQPDGSILFEGLSYSADAPFPFRVLFKDFTPNEYTYLFLQKRNNDWEEEFRFSVKRSEQ